MQGAGTDAEGGYRREIEALEAKMNALRKHLEDLPLACDDARAGFREVAEHARAFTEAIERALGKFK